MGVCMSCYLHVGLLMIFDMQIAYLLSHYLVVTGFRFRDWCSLLAIGEISLVARLLVQAQDVSCCNGEVTQWLDGK